MHRHLVTILAAVVAASATTFALAQAQEPEPAEPDHPVPVTNARVLEAVQKVRDRADEIRARAGEIRTRVEGIAARTKKIRENLTALVEEDVCVRTASGVVCAPESACVLSVDAPVIECPLGRSGATGRPARP